MTYARAGHTPLIYMRSLGVADERCAGPDPERHGGRAAHPRRAREVQRAARRRVASTSTTGDVIVLYTDGITEAMNGDADLFGDARLSRIVEEHGHLESDELRERILREIEAFVGTADQHDDMTMILMKVEQRGAAGSRSDGPGAALRTPARGASSGSMADLVSLPHAVADRGGRRPRPARGARHRRAGAVGHAADAVSDDAARAAPLGGGRGRRPRAAAHREPSRGADRRARHAVRRRVRAARAHASATASAIAACSSTR